MPKHYANISESSICELPEGDSLLLNIDNSVNYIYIIFHSIDGSTKMLFFKGLKNADNALEIQYEFLKKLLSFTVIFVFETAEHLKYNWIIKHIQKQRSDTTVYNKTFAQNQSLTDFVNISDSEICESDKNAFVHEAIQGTGFVKEKIQTIKSWISHSLSFVNNSLKSLTKLSLDDVYDIYKSSPKQKLCSITILGIKYNYSWPEIHRANIAYIFDKMKLLKVVLHVDYKIESINNICAKFEYKGIAYIKIKNFVVVNFNNYCLVIKNVSEKHMEICFYGEKNSLVKAFGLYVELVILIEKNTKIESMYTYPFFEDIVLNLDNREYDMIRGDIFWSWANCVININPDFLTIIGTELNQEIFTLDKSYKIIQVDALNKISLPNNISFVELFVLKNEDYKNILSFFSHKSLNETILAKNIVHYDHLKHYRQKVPKYLACHSNEIQMFKSSNLKIFNQMNLDIHSRFSFCYRYNFSKLPDSDITDDIGWGCLLRSAQSMLAEALARSLLGRGIANNNNLGWNISQLTQKETSSIYNFIISLFLDHFNSPFSIHSFCYFAQKNFSIKIGEWFSPTVLAHVIKEASLNISYNLPFLIFVVKDCLISHFEIISLLEKQPVVVLIPTRLGISEIHPIYYNDIEVNTYLCVDFFKSSAIFRNRRRLRLSIFLSLWCFW